MRPATKVSTDKALLIRDTKDITSAWLTTLLDEPTTLINVTPVGMGQVASTFRITFEGPHGPGSLIIKIASLNEGSREFGIEFGAYEKEVHLYAHIGKVLAATGVVAECRLAVLDDDEGYFSLVIEDIVDGVQGDQVAGMDVAQVKVGLETMAALHATTVNKPELRSAAWLVVKDKLDREQLYKKLLPGFVERYGRRLVPEHVELVKWFADFVAAHQNEPLGTLDALKHGDFRPDNLLFTPTRCISVDFQGASYGLLAHDAAFFISGSLTVEERRKHEMELLRGYVDSLQAKTGTKIDWDTVWWQYRRQSISALWITVIAGMMCIQSERGDNLFVTMTANAAQHALDMNIREIFTSATV